MRRNKLIALFAGLSLAFVSSAALAAPSADTLLVAGYDSNQMAVIYGVSDIDQEGDDPTLDCTLVGGFVYELEEAPAAETDELETDTDEVSKVAVTGLKTKGADDTEDGNVEFYFENDEDREGDSLLYGAEGAEDCTLTSVTIEPNGDGEINHGTVVSTFAGLLDGGKGCIIRHFAQSDFGKVDYDEPDPESFEVTLQSIKTSCDKQKTKDRVQTADGDDGGPGGNANAPGQTRQKPNKGKDSAPGQAKKNG